MENITVQELSEFQQTEYTIFRSSNKPQKQLICTLRGSFEVWHNGEKVWECMQPFTAVEKYNEIK